MTALPLGKLCQTAIVRGVPNSFTESLTSVFPRKEIDVSLAKVQHKTYVNTLKEIVKNVIEIPPDERFPDCPFVEDTVVAVGSRALITRPGAISRRGEVEAMKIALVGLNLTICEVQAPATIDGGDVLYAGGVIFVGLSRTNLEGVRALKSAFPDLIVRPVEVGPGGLHLKSVISMVNETTFAVEDNPEAIDILQQIATHCPEFSYVKVPDVGAANTLFVNGTLLFPSAYSKDSSKILSEASPNHVAINMSEFHKADGGLTCLSVLID